MNDKMTKKYFLGKGYTDVYFTQREMDCLKYILKGHTIQSTADFLALSSRTVEYYVKNMRMKIGVQSKTELIKAVQKINFIVEER